MKKVYNLIKSINANQSVTKEKGICKLTEEIGELAQVVNIELGIKKGSTKGIKDKAKSEIADCIQNLFSIANLYEITFDELTESLGINTTKWVNKYSKTKKK